MTPDPLVQDTEIKEAFREYRDALLDAYDAAKGPGTVDAVLLLEACEDGVALAESTLLAAVRAALTRELAGKPDAEVMAEAVEVAWTTLWPDEKSFTQMTAYFERAIRAALPVATRPLTAKLAERDALVNENFRLLQEAEAQGKRLHHRLMGLRADIEAQLKDIDRLACDERRVAEDAQFTLEAVATNIRTFLGDESDWPCLAEADVVQLRAEIATLTTKLAEAQKARPGDTRSYFERRAPGRWPEFLGDARRLWPTLPNGEVADDEYRNLPASEQAVWILDHLAPALRAETARREQAEKDRDAASKVTESERERADHEQASAQHRLLVSVEHRRRAEAAEAELARLKGMVERFQKANHTVVAMEADKSGQLAAPAIIAAGLEIDQATAALLAYPVGDTRKEESDGGA